MTALRRRMIETMQLRGLSDNTQRSYLQAIHLLAQHYHRSPDQVTDDDIRQYFLYLRNERQVARSTSTIALCAMKFLVEYVLHRSWPTLDLVRPPKSRTLPTVLSREEVTILLSRVRRPAYRTCLTTIYACGLRISEGIRLQVPQIDRGSTNIHAANRTIYDMAHCNGTNFKSLGIRRHEKHTLFYPLEDIIMA